MGRPQPHQEFSPHRKWHSIYVENFDVRVILSEAVAFEQLRQPLASQDFVRDAYAKANLKRDPAKSAAMRAWSLLLYPSVAAMILMLLTADRLVKQLYGRAWA
eukprot:3162636-Amphidinium_carterae.1